MAKQGNKQDYDAFPDEEGHFGPYGGRFVGETLMEAIYALEEAYDRYQNDAEFQAEMDKDLADFVGRP